MAFQGLLRGLLVDGELDVDGINNIFTGIRGSQCKLEYDFARCLDFRTVGDVLVCVGKSGIKCGFEESFAYEVKG